MLGTREGGKGPREGSLPVVAQGLGGRGLTRVAAGPPGLVSSSVTPGQVSAVRSP